MFNVLKLVLLHALGVFGHGQRIDHCLNVATQKSLQVVSSVADTMVGHAALWEVVCTDLSRAVAGLNQTLTAVSDIIHILLVLLIIYKGVQSAQCVLLVLRLVAGLGTLNQYLLSLARVRVLPHIAQAHTRFHLVHILTSST